MRALISEIDTLPEDIESRLKNLGLEYDIILNSDKIVNPEQYDIAFGANHIKKIGCDRFTKLKWIQNSYAGYNNLPVDEWKSKGILFTNAKDVFSDPIAEWVVLYILMYYKNALLNFELQTHKVWERKHNRELENMNVCIVGVGSIGQAIRKRLEPFNVHFIGVNSKGTPTYGFESVYAVRDLETAVMMSDIVVITLPLSDSTNNLFSREILFKMKKGSILLNVGRGKIIDEEALIEALESDHLGFCALDVMAKEPVENESKLWECKNMILTPHVSGTGDYTKERLWEIFEFNCHQFAEGLELKNIV
jgi:phosphoglycerate dehydrogenase-like enzyme